MKIRINFTLLSTSVKPFAIIEGWIDVERDLAKGDSIQLEWPEDLVDCSGSRPAQKIERIFEASDKYDVPNSGMGDLYSIDDVVMEHHADAEKLADFWRHRYGLHVMAYDILLGEDEERET